MKLDVDIRGHKATIERIRQGITDAMEDTAEELLDEAEDDAQDVLRDTRRIWTRETYHGFVKDVDTYRKTASARLVNVSPHAPIVERGADYGSEGPPVQSLIPWVAAHSGGGHTSTGELYGNDTGGGTGDTAKSGDLDDDDWEDQHLSISGEPRNLSEYGAEPDWQVHSSLDGFDAENVWKGQKVVIYNYHEDELVGGTVSNVRSAHSIDVTRSDGKTVGIFNNSTHKVLVASEDFDSLTDSEKDTAIVDTFDDIERSSDVNSLLEDDINQGVEEFNDLIKDKQQALNTAIQIDKFGTADRSNNESPNVSGSNDRGITIEYFNPENADPDNRKDRAKMRTIRHELGHAFVIANGYDRSNNSSKETFDWDTVELWEQNNGVLPFDWVEQGGPGNYHTDSQKTGIPHPKNYFLTSEDARDAVFGQEAPTYKPFSHWNDYIYRDVLSKTDDEPDYSGEDLEKYVFHPHIGDAREGGWLKLNVGEDHDVQEFKIGSPVKKYSADELPDAYSEDGWGIQVLEPDTGAVYLIKVDDEGHLVPDTFDYVDYADPSNVKEGLGPSDVPSDPGLYHNDDYGRFMEALNRAFYRQTLSSEVMHTKDYKQRILRRNYAATNGQETAAAFFEIFMGKSDEPTQDLEEAQKIYETYPLLLHAAAENFNVPQDFKDALTKQTGLSWSEILTDIKP